MPWAIPNAIPVSGSTTVTIQLSDAGNLVSSPGAAILTMTTAQFESLQIKPVANSGSNFTVTMSVTEYEVDASGTKLVSVAGAGSTTAVLVDVQAVTDTVDLKINGSDTSAEKTIDEDTTLDLKAMLSAAFQDLDGSEQRFIDLSGLPPGSVVNGVVVGAAGAATISLAGNTTTLPAINLTPPANFSGDINGIIVTLRAWDKDPDPVDAAGNLSRKIS